ncbi:alpha-L-arabinofuranosidase C-terminal domain-containing protein [Devosia nitrariae]|uniref:non-reducing end alpha-L-arabinofuranosidase n=1 Tax=Devosia nitrariae TaxID=2071872 RepID=A0ABQ5WB77_9HYPH|nr:alpha-L-arabinofuranosidase C-terminal domain-containing protein [Devosia nitrariae]GLQ56881.1 alpha-N-arabinofuranosidase [Devosia nitrariae]
MPTLTIDPQELHAISPRLYMQFMEPLGTTDSSVEAGWDVLKDAWREDFVSVTSDLAPGAIRWGGILTSFWKWRESVGDSAQRPPMVNYLWGGWEKNRVGVDEFLSFCRAVAADPILAVNFAGDGRPEYIKTALGEERAGDAREAADLVSYCNDPDSAERRAGGFAEPWKVKFWQIGNETSYPKAGHRFTAEENAKTYLEFAKAMRERDPGITLIGWGDQERDTGTWWMRTLIETAGDYVDQVALHMMQQGPDKESILHGRRYRRDYAASWAELGKMYDRVRDKLADARSVLAGTGSSAKLAITEGHLSLRPHNKSEMLREWISGLYHARIMTLFERNSDVVDVATLADFAGTTWTVNALMLGSPAETPYLLPVGHIMRFFRKHSGERAIAVGKMHSTLEMAASRSGDTVYLHVVNTDLDNEVRFDLSVKDRKVVSGRQLTINPGLDAAIDSTALDVFTPSDTKLADVEHIVIPKAAVSVLELALG